MIKSTITNNAAVRIREYGAKNIIKRYKQELSLDVSHFFTSDSLVLYQCPDTGYMFFYPEQISGDGKFYEDLQKFDWYYIPWKWEHEIASKYVAGSERILEVGCGQGGFMQKIKMQTGKELTGLELNEDAVKNLTAKGFKVLNRKIQDYAQEKLGFFDLVCTFQVLEHIYLVKDFVKGMVDCLRPGGKLIIAVPNNQSFIKYDEGGILNFPPHHMGWWDAASLRRLGNCFGLHTDEIFCEPLQDYHEDWYVQLVGKKYFSFSRIIWIAYEKLFKHFVRFLLKQKILRPKGHSILVVYSKSK